MIRTRSAIVAMSCAYLHAALVVAENPDFPGGVAAGDVTDSQAVCWTRTAAPESLRLDVATDSTFGAVVQSADVETSESSGLTARVDVTGLAPATAYFFRFVRMRDAAASPIGRFRTAPPPETAVPFRFVFTGDSDAAAQPFRILSFAEAEQADFWFWFGDTIYGDHAAGGLGVAKTLAEYREKYRQNLADPHLQSLLASTPVWTGWDDHEVGNDYDGGDPEPRFSREQIEAGQSAFIETMPIRSQGQADDPRRIYRSFRYGALAEFFILDGRQYRSADAERVLGGGGFDFLDPFGYILPTRHPVFIEVTRDPSRTLLGREQLEWLKAGLAASTARFKFIINPVPFTSLVALPADRWDGYGAERYDLLRSLDLAGVEGVVVLTTDSHANTVNPDITRYLRCSLGQEFSDDFAVPEFIAGPIGTSTAGSVVSDLAAALFGGPDNPIAKLIGDTLFGITLNQVASLNGLTFAEPDRFAYLVVDVTDSGVTLTHKGIPSDDADGTAELEILRSTQLDSSAQAPGPPCFLFPLAAFAGSWLWWRPRRQPRRA